MASFPNPQPPRPWQEVAQELAKEYNRTRIQELANELNLALAQLEAAPHGQDIDAVWEWEYARRENKEKENTSLPLLGDGRGIQSDESSLERTADFVRIAAISSSSMTRLSMPVSEVHRCQFFSSDSTFAPLGEREGMRTKTEMDMKEFHQTAIQSEDSHYVYFDLRSFGNRQGEAADSYMHDALMTIQAGGRISGERTVILITDVSTVIPDTARNRLAELRDAGVSISVQGRRS